MLQEHELEAWRGFVCFGLPRSRPSQLLKTGRSVCMSAWRWDGGSRATCLFVRNNGLVLQLAVDGSVDERGGGEEREREESGLAAAALHGARHL